MRIAGIAVAVEGLLMLFYMLHESGRADAVALSARMNEAAVLGDTDTTNFALSPAERDTVLGVLDDPPYALYELRAVLLEQQK